MIRIKYLIRKRQMGDGLWIEPVIRELAGKYKKLIVISKFNVLFENYPLKNVVFKSNLSIVEKIIERFEHFLNTNILFFNLDFSYEQDPLKHILHAYQKKSGLSIRNEYPKLFLSESEKIPFINEGSKYVILHIESFSERNYRHLYGIEWGEIIVYLKAKGFDVIQIGKSPKQIEGCRNINTNIRELISIINNASYFIGLDSGPSHIAAALKIPSLIFFGAINPEYRHFKESFKGFFLQQYCEFNGCYHKTPGSSDPLCKIVPNDQAPPCSIYSNDYLIKMIDLLLEKYKSKNDQ